MSQEKSTGGASFFTIDSHSAEDRSNSKEIIDLFSERATMREKATGRIRPYWEIELQRWNEGVLMTRTLPVHRRMNIPLVTLAAKPQSRSPEAYTTLSDRYRFWNLKELFKIREVWRSIRRAPELGIDSVKRHVPVREHKTKCRAGRSSGMMKRCLLLRQ